MRIDTKACNPANYGGTRGMGIVDWIVIHYTSNQGDTAKNNADYFAREKVGASAHYFVDEHEVWASVPIYRIAWHCGAKTYKHSLCRNTNSIGVEICMNAKDGSVRPGSIDNAAALVRTLMGRYGIPLDHVLRHYDVTGKHCPGPMVNSPALWEEFLKQLEEPELTESEVRKIVRDEYAKMQAETEAAPPHAWGKPAWDELTARGITDGTAPQAALTREQYAVMQRRQMAET